MKTISELKVDDTAYIKKIDLEKNHKRHIQDLGLHLHAKVSILNKTRYDTLVIIDDYTKLTLGNEVSKHIFVEI